MDKIAILLVDDDRNLIEGIKRVLRSENFEIYSATSANQAFAMFKERQFDVVVSDEKMPGMRGVEFLTQIKNSYPNTVRMMLSGNPEIGSVVRALNQAQVFRFFLKPCNAQEIVAAINEGLVQRSLLLEVERLLRNVENNFLYTTASENENNTGQVNLAAILQSPNTWRSRKVEDLIAALKIASESFERRISASN